MRYAKLIWVKPSIDDTLKQIQQSLEQVIENPEDTGPLQDAVVLLHEINGVLEILQIEAAIILVKEITVVMQALIDNNVLHKEKSYDVLMHGIIQYLPNYLDHLALGYADEPLALLMLINRLRSFVKKKALTPNQMFFPNIYVNIPVKPAPVLANNKFRAYVNKLRISYIKGLNIWIKGKGANKIAGLKLLLSTFDKLTQITGKAAITRVWWINAALLESIAHKGLAPSATTNNLLKQVDLVLKPLIIHGMVALKSAPPKKYILNLLHFAVAVKSKGARILAVKKAFNLTHPNKNKIHKAQMIFSGPDIELVNIAVNILMEEFNKVEDTLDIFMRSDNKDINDLQSTVESMNIIAYTLQLLGLNIQSQAILEQKKLILAIIAGRIDHDMSNLIKIIYTILKVSAALKILNINGMHAYEQLENNITSANSLLAKDVVKDAVSEAKRELKDIIEIIVYFIDKGSSDELKAIPLKIKYIQGLFAILSKQRAIKLLQTCNQYISHVFIKENKVPIESICKTLADTLVSFELYLDTLAGNPTDSELILDDTQYRLKILISSLKSKK
jgi:chemosensory pili system protein ChpA (sensor histidine kinase/response regulator)